MKGKKKLTLITLIVMFVLTCTFGLVACTKNGDGTVSAKDAIERYLLPQNETTVSENFTLPKKIGKDNAITVNWESDNKNAIEIVDATEQYTAKVTLQDEVTPVKLTISAEGNSKDFTVRVDELTAFTFIDNFKFAQEGTAVNDDFELETKATLDGYEGKEATIAWSVEDEDSQGYIEVVEEGGKTKLHIKALPEDLTSVKLRGTFTFTAEKKAFKDFAFSLSPELEHLQQVNRFYSVTDYPLELSGYITHVVEASESYGNATFYMIDDDFCSGYYCYRVTINKADVAKYKDGVHVTITGDKTKNYNGLWENNSGGEATVDDTDTINPRDKVYALDTDLLAGAPSMLWHESTFVSLTGWKVASKPKEEDKPVKGSTGTLFTLKKGDATISVAYTKYASYAEGADDALIAMYDTIEVDDIVNVTGLLGCYNTANGGAFDPNKFQIQPLSASDIQVVTTGEVAYENGAKIKAAIAEVEKELAAKKLNGLITTNLVDVEMPTEKDGVAISYRLAGHANLATPTLTIGTDGTVADGKFTVTPTRTEHNYDIEVTYTIGEYKAYSFFKLRNWALEPDEIVEMVKVALNSAKMSKQITAAGDFALPQVETYGATVTWKIATPTTLPEWLKVDGQKLVLSYLPLEETELVLEATIAYEGATSVTVTRKVTVAATPTKSFEAYDTAKTGKSILSAIYKDVRRYVTGTTVSNNKNYFETSADYADAAEFTVAQVTGGYTIQIGKKFVEVKEGALNFPDTATEGAVWTWNDTLKIFTFKEGDDTFYMGTYDSSKYTTFGVSNITFIWDTANNKAKDVLDKTQHPCHFGEMKDATDEGWANEILGKLDLEKKSFDEAATVTLPTTQQYGATVTWSWNATPDASCFSLTGTTLTITPPASGTKTATLKVEVAVKDAKVSKTIDITVEHKVVSPFHALETPASGTYKFMMHSENETKKGDYYATGGTDSYYLATTTDVSEAADFVITQIDNENKYTITVNGKYLEIVPRSNNSKGTNVVMNTTQTQGKYWQWNDAIKNFVCESTYNDSVATNTDLYYCGNYSENTSINSNQLSYIATKNADGTWTANNKEGVSQWVAHFGTYTAPAHTHNYVYTYDATTGWQHTGHCDVADCPDPDITEDCTGGGITTCSKCNHQFTETEIVNKLFALSSGSLKGTWSLTGKVMRIDYAYTASNANVSFTIKIGDKEIYAYKEASTYSATVKPGDQVTVQGALKIYGSTREFDAGCKITSLTPGELTEEEKLSEAILAASKNFPETLNKDYTLPTSIFNDVTFTWVSDKTASITVDNGVLKVTQTSDNVQVKITLTAKIGTNKTETKDFTITVEAKAPEGSVTSKVNIKEYGAAQDTQWTNNTKYESVSFDNGKVTATAGGKNSSAGTYYTANNDWRFYQTSGGSELTFTATSGYKIFSIKITYKVSNSGILKLKGADTTYTSGTTILVKADTITFEVGNSSTKTNGQVQITEIEVIYYQEAAASAVQAPVALLPRKDA